MYAEGSRFGFGDEVTIPDLGDEVGHVVQSYIGDTGIEYDLVFDHDTLRMVPEAQVEVHLGAGDAEGIVSGLPLKPMLCQEAPFDEGASDLFAHERKWDGWRFLFWRTEAGVKSYAGRNGSDRTGQPAAVEAALAFLPADTIIDCELIDPGGQASDVATALAKGWHLEAIAFDILRVAGTDVAGLPWSERRALLEKAAEGFSGPVSLAEVYEPDEALHQAWVDEGGEGSVLKRKDSTYREGKHGRKWLKVKPQKSDEAIVLGFVEGNGGWAGHAGAFELQMLESGVRTTCGTLDDSQRAAIKADPDAFLGKVIEIRHHGLFNNGKPRHPVFGRMRPDRDPA